MRFNPWPLPQWPRSQPLKPSFSRPSQITLPRSLLGLVGMVGLVACSNAAPPASTDMANAPAPTVTSGKAPSAPPRTETQTPATPDHSTPVKGGQVVETGRYHLELVPVPAADGIHLDLYLQTGDDHAAIPDAKVTAQVQLPNGNQQALPMAYDPTGEHYFAVLPSQAPGEYRVVILTEIGGEPVNSRFTFTQ